VQVIGTATLVYDKPTDLLEGQALGEFHVGILIERLDELQAKLRIPGNYTKFESRSGALTVGDLPLKRVIDWPRDRLRPVETGNKKVRVGKSKSLTYLTNSVVNPFFRECVEERFLRCLPLRACAVGSSWILVPLRGLRHAR
jgi:hypothetical protein